MRSRFIGCVLGASLASAALPSLAAEAVSDGVVKIGILNDLSGIYSDFTGRGSAVAAQIAIDEMGGKVLNARSSSSRPTTRTSPTSPPTSPGNGSTRARST